MSNATEALRRFAASSLLPQLEALAAEFPGVRAAEDIECIHRMRVASRRIRTRLRLFTDFFPPKRLREWRDDMRRITLALGAARDLDVQIDFLQSFIDKLDDQHARPGVEAVLHGLRTNRAATQHQVNTSLVHFAQSEMLPDLHGFLLPYTLADTTDIDDSGEQALQALIEKTLTAQLSDLIRYEVYLAFPDREEQHHAMRIAAKHVRYTIETFSPILGDWIKPSLKIMRSLQDMLGDIHDSDVWAALLSGQELLELLHTSTVAIPAELLPGIALLQHDRRAFREKRYAEVVALWQEKQREQHWFGLLVELRQRQDSSDSDDTESSLRS